jgi:hypothetical protein
MRSLKMPSLFDELTKHMTPPTLDIVKEYYQEVTKLTDDMAVAVMKAGSGPDDVANAVCLVTTNNLMCLHTGLEIDGVKLPPPTAGVVKQGCDLLLGAISDMIDLAIAAGVRADFIKPGEPENCQCPSCQLRRALSGPELIRMDKAARYYSEEDLKHAPNHPAKPSPWGLGMEHKEQVHGGALQVPGREAEPSPTNGDGPKS